MTKYRSGFNECTNEVMRYLGNVQNVNDDVRSRLVNHLSSCSQTVNATTQTAQSQSQQMIWKAPEICVLGAGDSWINLWGGCPPIVCCDWFIDWLMTCDWLIDWAVKHLRSLQRQQMSSALANDTTVMTKYRSGFNECTNEVMRYLGNVQNVKISTSKTISDMTWLNKDCTQGHHI
jgi:hypothetical protein